MYFMDHNFKKLTYSVVQRRFFFFFLSGKPKNLTPFITEGFQRIWFCATIGSWILNLALRDSCLALENIGCFCVAFFGKDLAPKWRWLDIEGVNMAVEQETGPWLFCCLGTCSESWRPVPFKIKMGKREFTLFFCFTQQLLVEMVPYKPGITSLSCRFESSWNWDKWGLKLHFAPCGQETAFYKENKRASWCFDRRKSDKCNNPERVVCA